MIFGLVQPEIEKKVLREKLESHESFIMNVQREKWKRIPKEFQKGLESAYYLRTHHYRDQEGEVRLLAEWDSVESYKFRGEVLWSAKTCSGTLRLKHLANPWMMTIEGEWDVAPRVSMALFGRLGQISKINFPYKVLQDIIDADGKVEYKGKWKGIESGLDGLLEGSLPKSTGTRSDFDDRGERCFAKFESRELGRVLSISCEKGYISSNSVPPEELIKYFQDRILPSLRLP